MANFRPDRRPEAEFEQLVLEALPALFDGATVVREPSLARGLVPDAVLERVHEAPSVVEIRAVHPTTSTRLDRLINQAKALQTALDQQTSLGPGRPIIVVAGVLAGDKEHFARVAGVDVVDGPRLRDAAPHISWPTYVADDSGGTGRTDSTADLRKRLQQLPPGRDNWFAFQEVVRDILSELLTPPLATPLWERQTENGVNRRDIILPNYAESGFWAFVRAHYEAHYIVVDAKNLVGGVTKAAVLQVANYLEAHGTGLFGIIVCRTASDRAAEVTRREQWAIHRKLIVVLNDEDLHQMLTMRESDLEPAELIRQKIEDFRLGF
jgi:hypothetical protein